MTYTNCILGIVLVIVLVESEADETFMNAVFELLLERLATDKVGALAALLEAAGEAEARLEWAVIHSQVRVPVTVSYKHTTSTGPIE